MLAQMKGGLHAFAPTDSESCDRGVCRACKLDGMLQPGRRTASSHAFTVKPESPWCLQGADCNRPASPTTGAPAAGSCWFDASAVQAINNKSLPSFSLEEAEFAVPLKDLRSVIADIRAMKALGGDCWSPSFIQLRPGGSTPDLIGPVSGAPWERFVWIELAIFRPNLPGPIGAIPPRPVRYQKKLAGLQEAFEQLMVCK